MGKAHYMGKVLTEVRSPQRKLAPDIVGSDHRKPTSLRGIADRTFPVGASCTEAGMTEEPDAENLHVRDCAGGAG
jgi:hypothetical protein